MSVLIIISFVLCAARTSPALLEIFFSVASSSEVAELLLEALALLVANLQRPDELAELGLSCFSAEEDAPSVSTESLA